MLFGFDIIFMHYKFLFLCFYIGMKTLIEKLGKALAIFFKG